MASTWVSNNLIYSDIQGLKDASSILIYY